MRRALAELKVEAQADAARFEREAAEVRRAHDESTREMDAEMRHQLANAARELERERAETAEARREAERHADETRHANEQARASEDASRRMQAERERERQEHARAYSSVEMARETERDRCEQTAKAVAMAQSEVLALTEALKVRTACAPTLPAWPRSVAPS